MKLLFRLAALGLGLLVAFVIVEIGLRAAGMGFGNSPMEASSDTQLFFRQDIHFTQE